MTNCTQKVTSFPALKRRRIEAEFTGGEITSDTGALFLREIDRKLGLTGAMDKAIPDERDERYIQHSQLSLLRQRIYSLGLGYEDLNDQDTMRSDPALVYAVESDQSLSSASTLCRLENRMDRPAAVALHEVMIETFIASFKKPPAELILDFDATDDRVHGNQVGRHYHGYYHDHCFLPLYVFCEDQLLVGYLRPSNKSAARHAWGILALLVKRFRQQWPDVEIVFRGDAGFCRHDIMTWCERHGVGYIVGIGRNQRITKRSRTWLDQAEQEFKVTQEKVRVFGEFRYGSKTWTKGEQIKERRVIVKAEQLVGKANPRYIVTNLSGDPKHLYEKVYCARGEMENRIKEQQLDMFADRTSCHVWWANQFRMLLSGFAYILMERLRSLVLKNTELAHAYVGTIRLKLLKIGAVVLQNTRRIRFLCASAYPHQALFQMVAARLAPD